MSHRMWSGSLEESNFHQLRDSEKLGHYLVVQHVQESGLGVVLELEALEGKSCGDWAQ